MSLWYHETFDNRVQFGLRVTKTLATQRSEYQLVEIIETEAYGRTLLVDGIYMTSEGDEHHYHEMIVHPALTTTPSPKRVLIIGGGDGGTAREVLRHSEVEKVVLCEIDQVVVDLCKEFLPNHFSWDDERFELRVGDGIQFVKDAPEDSFDVVLLDGSDPVGPAAGLFNRSFYEGVKRVLNPAGVFALQSESHILMPDVFMEIQRTLGDLFTTVSPYFGPVPIYGGGIWSWTFASDSVDPLAIDDGRAERIEANTKYYNRDIHRGAFALPNDLKRSL